MRVNDPSQITCIAGARLGGYQATVFVPGDKTVVKAYKGKAIWKDFASIENYEIDDNN